MRKDHRKKLRLSSETVLQLGDSQLAAHVQGAICSLHNCSSACFFATQCCTAKPCG